jgi:hypothetical protein
MIIQMISFGNGSILCKSANITVHYLAHGLYMPGVSVDIMNYERYIYAGPLSEGELRESD